MIFLLPDTVDQTAAQTPDREAFRCRRNGITYAELAIRTNQLAQLLVERGVKPGDRVGIRLRRCVESAVAVHGIMKAGAAFVPVDPFLPSSGLARLIDDCGLRHLISQELPAAREQMDLETVIGPENEQTEPVRSLPWKTLDCFPGNVRPDVRTTEQDLAYIMYTSGSTGRPKGIMHTHRSGLSYAELSAATYDVRPADRIGNHSPLHFDMSTFGYFAGPLAGATTVLIPEEYTKLPASLSQLMEDERISIWYSVPSPLIQLLARGVLDRRDLSCLRWVKFGGEPFAARHLKELMDLWPQARFSNVYGPAEVNQCTWYHVPPSDDITANVPIPIGKVWENSDGLVLDENDQPVLNGDVGELAIRSATMMQGYWNQPELTERSFFRQAGRGGMDRFFYRTGDLVRLEDDGNFQFLGRRDRQIKTRGHRVELDDVEAALVACREVLESAAYVVDDGEGSRVIEAAVIPRTDTDLSVIDLMSYAKRHLPPYAVPVQIGIRSDFPRTTTGKVDRLTLQREAEVARTVPLKIGHRQNH